MVEKKVLVINAGSSSFKYQLIDMNTEQALCSGLVERIGEPVGALVHKVAPGTAEQKVHKVEQVFADHSAGMNAVISLLTDATWGVVKDMKEISAVGHRVVLGGPDVSEDLVTPALKETIRSFIPLSPLHNPANLSGIEVVEKLMPGIPSVAVFDTGFHTTIPDYAYTYAIPKEVAKKSRLRRYGFHGTSHRFVSREAALFLGLDPAKANIICCHLGNGCSITAIEKGRSVETSMGLTPLEGLVMGTRSGDLDPAILTYLMQHENYSADQVANMLNKQSGMKGLCGFNDMRDLETAMDEGNADAKLALQIFVHRLRKYIGSYYAVLGHVDALVFTGGIGENDNLVRGQACANLQSLGIELDEAANNTRASHARKISTPSSKVAVLVVPTNEELEIARATIRVLGK